MITTVSPVSELDPSIVRKLFWRLLPLMFVLYVVAYLDRINVGFAALEMRGQLHLTDAVYGRAAGMFFLGYLLFQLPSNLVLERVGVRRWISALMITWGLVSGCTIFVRGPMSFYVLRFLLGAAEAGFFPGMILYMKRWFPPSTRARAVAWFMTANPLAGFFGSLISGALLGVHGAGLSGWQWLFVMEALPAVVFGVAVSRLLPETPATAKWLSAAERGQLMKVLVDHGPPGALAKGELREVIFNWRLWMLTVVYFALPACMYGVTFWLPIAIGRVSNFSHIAIGAIAAVPYIITAAAMVLVGMHSDRTQERAWHIAGPAFAGAVALAAASLGGQPILIVVAMTLGMMGAQAMTGPFWAMATEQLGAQAAAGIAIINSVANLGGYFGPDIIGRTGQLRGMLAIALTMILSGSASLVVGKKPKSSILGPARP